MAVVGWMTNQSAAAAQAYRSGSAWLAASANTSTGAAAGAAYGTASGTASGPVTGFAAGTAFGAAAGTAARNAAVGNPAAVSSAGAAAAGSATSTAAGAAAGDVAGAASGDAAAQAAAVQGTTPVECQTCKARKYVDGSNDPGVSFKTPGHIDPGSAASVVMGHEQEHVRNNQASAAAQDREIVSQTVSLHTAICPECGRVYVSGGTTRTVTRGAPAGGSGASTAGTDLFTNNYKRVMSGAQGAILDARA